MKRFLLTTLLLILPAMGQDEPTEPVSQPWPSLEELLAEHQPLLSGNDECEAQAFVPSPSKPQGEVRLLKRGESWIMQNILYSKFLKRAIGVVRRKEERVWKEGMSGYSDSQLYSTAMDQARQYVWELFKVRENKEDRRQKLAVELILAPDASIIVFYSIEISEAEKEVTITEKRPFLILPVSREYIIRDMHLIARDVLDFSLEKAQEFFPIPYPEKEEEYLKPESPEVPPPDGE